MPEQVAVKKRVTKAKKKTKISKSVKVSKKTKKTTKSKVSTKSLGSYDLVIVESSAKVKTIKKYLGKGYKVTASNGHVKDLPKSKLGVDIDGNFDIELVPIAGKKEKIKKLQEFADGANTIFLATDPDREGEAIAFHLAEEIGGKGFKKCKRVLFNAVTKNVIIKAIESPTILDQAKYDAQKTRRVLDRLVGYKISPILWDKVQRGLSAGRVQSVALRIIVERENEIKAFTPEQWFSIHSMFKKSGIEFDAKYFGEEISKRVDLIDESIVNSILSDIQKVDNKFDIQLVKRRERKQNPTPPFTTSKLQQESANKLGFSAKKTMMIAQHLYEGVEITGKGMQGLVTYMRTDSVRTESEALDSLREYIANEHGKDFLSETPIVYKKKGKGKVQDAHEAIRPTSLEFSPEIIKGDLSTDEFKLYNIIWKKFISSQMAPAVIDQTAVMLESAGHFFKANGSIIKFPGFRLVYLEDAIEKRSRRGENDDESSHSSSVKAKNRELPDLDEGEQMVPISGVLSEEHWTTPPPRYSEASLVKELEEQGIGRPSTYASIISNIQDRGYVEKIEKRFISSELGNVVCQMLIESFSDIMDIEFTAKIEELLDQIEDNEINWRDVLSDFWKSFEPTLAKAKEEMKNLKKQLIPTGIKCTKCENGEFNIKWGRNGKFLACENYPECTGSEDFKQHLDGTLEIVPKKYANEPCPECGKRMVIKKGKYGRFLACEEYPNCKASLPYTIDVICPECKVGKFAEKKSRYGKIFYGCSNYPDCSNAVWAMPYKFICQFCGYPVMVEKETKRDGHQLQCPKCKYKVDWEDTPFHKKDDDE